MSEILIRSVMTPFPHAVDADDPLDDARQMMESVAVRHLPVKHREQLVGLVTDRDIKLVLGPYCADSNDAEAPKVRHACVFDVYTVEMTTPLRVVAAEMARRRIGSALVTKEGRLAGIFTATDACRCLADLLEGGEAPGSDEAA